MGSHLRFVVGLDTSFQRIANRKPDPKTALTPSRPSVV